MDYFLLLFCIESQRVYISVKVQKRKSNLLFHTTEALFHSHQWQSSFYQFVLLSRFPKSECDRINALVNAKKAQSAVAEATALLESLKAGHFPSSPSEIRLTKTVPFSVSHNQFKFCSTLSEKAWDISYL